MSPSIDEVYSFSINGTVNFQLTGLSSIQERVINFTCNFINPASWPCMVLHFDYTAQHGYMKEITPLRVRLPRPYIPRHVPFS